ncbi:hypothetical protein ABZ384_14455 [Streptomyces cyaneofuscatus]|uniref:hypothetical protein n=1 Tax=Streptomyces cyaneofuscatus TaxID=66883 RepID=UPI0033F25FED
MKPSLPRGEQGVSGGSLPAADEPGQWFTGRALRLKELLFPSIADVAVLSVDVNFEMVRVDAQSVADGAVCPSAESGRTGFMVPACGFPLMCRVVAEVLFSS